MEYVIHAVPKRMWYVEGYLIPSMKEQGISEDRIRIWNDSFKKGNLISCMECFLDCGKRKGGTWHLQDDVVISSDFAEKTSVADDKVMCGFCCEKFEATTRNIGKVTADRMWYSFQCIYIPNSLAGECAEWFFNDAMHRKDNQNRVIQKKNDDWFWREFVLERHKNMEVINMNPNIADHIDFLVGGSLINQHRINPITRAYYFKDTEQVTKLRGKLGLL